MSGTWFVICLLGLTTAQSVNNPREDPPADRYPAEQRQPSYWRNQAKQTRMASFQRKFNFNIAKNVILFLGDGMGLSSVTAGRIFQGQQKGGPGEDEILAWENWDHSAMIKTYNSDHQIPDSAGTGTAYLCGVKAPFSTVGVDGDITRQDCSTQPGHEVPSIIDKAEEAGKSTGFVTTARVTHASPASLFASSVERDWEADSQLPDKSDGCKDIAAQLMDFPGRDIEVIMAGGRRALYMKNESDPEYPSKKGRRDRRNIKDEWMRHQRGKGLNAEYVWNRDQFNNINPKNVDHLLGLFEYSHMRYDKERDSQKAKDEGEKGEPSLSEMTGKAIDILKKNNKGFFLFVEGARIDHGHHANLARRALEEVTAMDLAVRTALSKVDLKDTLIIVTADHSTPLTSAGYAYRGRDILGLTDYSGMYSSLSDVDGLPYTTLLYSTGPGWKPQRDDLTNVDTTAEDYMQRTALPTVEVAHDLSDVGLWAAGPMAHMFHTTHEQHYIFHVMTYAACMGDDDVDSCRTRDEALSMVIVNDDNPNTSSSNSHCGLLLLLIFCFLICT